MKKTNSKNAVINHNMYAMYIKSATKPRSILERLTSAIEDKTYSDSPRKLADANNKSVFVGVHRNPITELVSWVMHDRVRGAVTAHAQRDNLEESDFLWEVVYKSEGANIKLSLAPLSGNEKCEVFGFICEKKSDIRKEFDTNRIAGKNKEVVLNRMAAQVAEVEEWVNNFANSINAIDVTLAYEQDNIEDLATDMLDSAVEHNETAGGGEDEATEFVVTISERSIAYLTIKANSRQEAIEIASEQHGNGEVMFEHYEDFNITAKEADAS